MNWTELNWNLSSVQLHCTDCTKQTNWQFSSSQFSWFCTSLRVWKNIVRFASGVRSRGVDPYGTGGTRPPNIWTGGIITNVPLNISRVMLLFIHAIFSW